MASPSAQVVAVDGPAASGKGTLSKRLAQALRFAYLDTGLLYRATALRELRRHGFTTLHDACLESAAESALAISAEDLADSSLRSELVGQCASMVSTDARTRSALLQFQRSFCDSPPQGLRGAVLDGRDIGTVVCPGAAVKFFVTADAATRAVRRHSELCAAGTSTSLEQVKRDMQQRDLRDSSRATAPLCAAPDAFVIDTTCLTADEVFATAMDHVRDKLPVVVNNCP